jgi:hypothetical protein
VSTSSSARSPTSAATRPLVVDLGFVTGLLLLAAVPLIGLRGSPRLHAPWLVPGFCVAWLVTAGLWPVIHRRVAGRAPPAASGEPGTWAGRIGTTLQAVLLLALTLVTFFDPLRRHFWGGFDEPNSLGREAASFWGRWDAMGRPLVGLPPLIGQTLAPDRIDGFLWLAVGLCFANSLLLMAVIRRLIPGAGPVAAVAAVLFVANRAEPLLFFPMWTTNFYWMALFWLLLAFWLLLSSHDRQDRGLLAASCASLGAALLTSEGLFPLALLGPVFLWLRRASPQGLLIWSSAWLGTVGLFAVRFGAYLLSAGPGAYQARLLPGWSPTLFLANLEARLAPLLTYFRQPAALGSYWRSWLLALIVTSAVVALATRARRSAGLRPAYGLGLGLAAAGILLGIAPFLHLGSWRTQYFAAPGQAALLAFTIVLLASLLPGRLARWLTVAIAGVLVANATAESLRSQDAADATIRFDKTAHIFRQVHAVSPGLEADTLVLFVLDDGGVTPLGVNYHVCDLSRIVMNVAAVQANFADPLGHVPTFTSDGVTVLCPWRRVHYAYDRIVAFRLAVDGSVRLLSQLPSSLLPAESAAGRYDPLGRMRPGPVGEPPYLRYVSWSEKPHDVLDTESGVLLGARWGPLEHDGRRTSRLADNDAEIVVNPAGRDRRDLALDVEPGGDLRGRPGELRALDATGHVVASARLRGDRQPLRLTLPLDPSRVAIFRLRVVPADPSGAGEPAGYFRVSGPDS